MRGWLLLSSLILLTAGVHATGYLMGDTLHMCMHVQQREEEKDCDLVGLFVAQCFSPSGGGRAVTAKADRRKEKRRSFTSSARQQSVSSLPPQSWLWSHDQWAGIPLFTLLKIDSTHCDDVASRDKIHPPLPSLAPHHSPPPPPSLIQTRVQNQSCHYWYATAGPAVCQLSSNPVWCVFGEAGERNLAFPHEEEMARREEGGGEWMERQGIE